MNIFIENFIEKNINLIDDNNWAVLYDTLYKKDLNYVHIFTEYMLDCGINPLNHMAYVPKYFLAYSKKYKDIRIPEGVKCIQEGAFKNCTAKNLFLPSTLVNIEENTFQGCGVDKVYIEDLDGFAKVHYEGPGANPLVQYDRKVQLFLQGTPIEYYGIKPEINMDMTISPWQDAWDHTIKWERLRDSSIIYSNEYVSMAKSYIKIRD